MCQELTLWLASAAFLTARDIRSGRSPRQPHDWGHGELGNWAAPYGLLPAGILRVFTWARLPPGAPSPSSTARQGSHEPISEAVDGVAHE